MNDAAVLLFGKDFVSLALADPEGGRILAEDIEAVRSALRDVRAYHAADLSDETREYCAGLDERVKIGLIWLLCDKAPEGLEYLGVKE